jgi:hypothetical protein
VLATVIDVEALRDVVVWAFCAGIGVTAVFGFVIYGSTRFADLRREGNAVAAAVVGALAVVGVVAFLGAVVVGILVMTSK